jgi:hypothetical protein
MQYLAILPYLKTSGTVTIRGIVLRSSAEVDSEAQSTKEHLSTLFSMFFLKDNLHIKEMSYAVVDLKDNDQRNDQIIQRLVELHHLLAYFYSSPHPTFLDPFLKREHANLYIFTPEPISQFLICPDNQNLEAVSSVAPYPAPNDRHEMPGYRGSLNNESPLWVTKGSRIYPPSSHFWLNLSQDLYSNLPPDLPRRSSILGGFLSLMGADIPLLEPIKDRIFTALKWYNRSNSIDAGDDIALLHLAIAFESLLALEQGPQITQRFKESVRLLVGPVTKLENWTDQFYNARSRIVHEGSSAQVMFYANLTSNKPSAQYRSLVSYGRTIFRICLDAIITGAEKAHHTGLASLFTTNQERFEEICKVLTHTNPGSSDAILSLRNDILDIGEYQFVEEENIKIETMLAANQLAARHLIAINPEIPPELLALYSYLANAQQSRDHFEELDTIMKIIKHIGNYESTYRAAPTDDATSLVLSLTRSVHHYIFMHYYALKSLQDKKAEG